MKITFPHMGNTFIAAKTFLDEFNIDYIIPPFNNKRALELGTKYAPEMACLPLKINIGNYIQVFEQGADTVMITGGCGPCRFGYYGELEKEILKDMGIEMDFITLEVPSHDIKEFIRRIKKLTGSINPVRLINAFAKTSKIVLELDELEKVTFKVRPREVIKGTTSKIYKEFLKKSLNTKGYFTIRKLIKETKDRLLHVEIDREKEILKVGIVGEIYTTIDPFTNLNIETKLGDMGIEVDRSVTISSWVIEHMIKKFLKLPRDLEFAKEAEPYLGTLIGGHAQETVGNTILYAKNNFDGVIQIYPLTCMPEIVAQSILPKIEKDFDIPVMTLIIDEMTGEEGYLTRVEAFVDLLKKRKEKSLLNEKWILSGN